MSFRTVVITKQAKISYKNKYLVVRQDVEEVYVHLSEIDTIIVDSIAVSISSYLLKEISDNKINIIFCDEKHNPFGELSSFYSNYNTSKKIMIQCKWDDKIKNELWQKIIKNKILNQSLLVSKLKNENATLLFNYVEEVKIGDKTNREGHASKVYFNALFGKKFIRHANDSINSALNYGYAILLSTFNKEIISNGYITQLGIHHKNEFNPFNFSCDLMEPFRIVIDNYVYFNKSKDFDNDYKMNLVNILNTKYKFNGKNFILKDIIKMYVKNIIECIDEDKVYKGFVYNEE